jgi:hypothetical protein
MYSSSLINALETIMHENDVPELPQQAHSQSDSLRSNNS